MAENHDKLITNLVLIGAGYFLLLKPILEKVGITKSAEQQAEDVAVNTANNSNGWDPNFYKLYLKTATGNTQLKTQAGIASIAQQIYRAWGLFNDDEDKIYAAFRQIRSQVELSQLCEKYASAYKRDLLAELKKPWTYLHDGLTLDQFAYLAKIINKLPVAIKL